MTFTRNQVAFVKDNPATRAAQRVAELRAQLGTRADRGLPPADSGVVGEVDVRQAPLGANGEPLPIVSPLTPEQIAERNRIWEMQTGQRLDAQNNIVPAGVSDDEDIPAPDYSPGDGPVHVDPLFNVSRTQTGRINTSLPNITPPPARSRPIDFARMEAIHPLDGIVIVDGMSFQMNDVEKQAAALMLARIVQRAMEEQLIKGLLGMGLKLSPEDGKDDGNSAAAATQVVSSLPEEGAAAPAPVLELPQESNPS